MLGFICENEEEKKKRIKRYGTDFMSHKFKMCAALPGSPSNARAQEIAQAFDLPKFVADVLVSRGIQDVDEAERYLSPSLERDWLNPYAIADLEDAVDALQKAIEANQNIVVFGDFDLDGISATVVMTRAIRALGGKATPFIPHRFDEGYGLTEAAIQRVQALEPDLLVTVDCGISCAKEVQDVLEKGISVVVTDHHEAGLCKPSGIPVVDPKAETNNPSAILAGVGVALKVVQALGSRFGYPHLWRRYTDFATLGTVADLMPMRDENRALVSDGLVRMNKETRVCISALAQVAGVAGKEFTSTNLSFSIIPRLNAAGRMGEADVALNLLMSDSEDEALAYATRLEELNSERRRVEAELTELAEAEAQKAYGGKRVLVVSGRDWHEGVKGIVASRLVNRYSVPTLLFRIDGDQARGSGRSVGNVNLYKAVESASDLLSKFGGHGAAVGVTLPVENLEAFTRRLEEYMDSLAPEEFEPMLGIDACIALGDINLKSVEAISRLAPFGQENQQPVFFAHNVLIDNCRAVGVDKTHFSCTLTDGCNAVTGILFNCRDIDMLLGNEYVVDAAFALEIDEWRGVKNAKAMLKAIEPARKCGGFDACSDVQALNFINEMFDCRKPDADMSKGAWPIDREADGAQEAREARRRWSDLASKDPISLQSEIVRSIIGDNVPHEVQQNILKRLAQGQSVLGIMATGRGKSLIFQVHAALIALRDKKASLFIYPLRALMADQAFHLSCQFSKFGLVCRVLNGETSEEERADTYRGLKEGDVDIVLTTPEYLAFHAEKIAECSRIGFMVVDEAHHIGQAKAGTRLSYRDLGEVARALGDPVVLALTATANDAIAKDIAACLPLSDRIVDETPRNNLHIDDKRNLPSRDDYMAHIISSGEKCVIYVNSREFTVAVARRLRCRVPHLATMIGFYNAGLCRDERTRIEDLFRRGDIRVLVSTSAFGEGIDIPDIRHVVLYHMPFSDIEFNQMAGRAGRDGKDAWIHLLYGRTDAGINRGILEEMTPGRDVMAQVYRILRSHARKSVDPSGDSRSYQADPPQRPVHGIGLSLEEIADLASSPKVPITTAAVACGVMVFKELGLIDVVRTYNGGVEKLVIHVNEDASHVELTDSVRYREGLDEIDDFMDFRDWAMKCDIQGLTIRVTHPISPNS